MEKNPVSQLNRFQSTIDKWINALEHFSFEQLSFKPANGGWSLGQLYQHILDDTNWYFKQIEISLLDKDHINSEKSEEAKLLFTNGSFKENRIKGDPLTAENIKHPPSIQHLKSEYESLKNSAEILYKNISFHSSEGKSKHPGLGYFNCREWFQFAEIHMRHHLQQKNRIETSLQENP